MEKFIIADGTAIRISDTGSVQDHNGASGNVIVLLHGYLENLNVWDTLTDFLQSHVRVIALDLPGHGISEVKGPVHSMDFLADVVYGALLELKVSKCTIIGHSMGGYVALALAARRPEILEGLVLFSSTPNADSDSKKQDREREIAIVEAGKKELLSHTQPAKGFAPENRKKFTDEIEDLAELVMLTEDEGIIALLRGMAQRPDRNEMLADLKIQQLFILGRHDEYITPEIADQMIARHPAARVVWLEHSGHMGLVEEPRLAADAILDFVNNNQNAYNNL
jgi:pimeloyl-ACP methyl ester carboxylesterase